jgi:hypothetical protein
MNRERLPNRRICFHIEFEHMGQRFIGSYGLHKDEERLAEIFINGWKTGSDSETNMRDASLSDSGLLQSGWVVDQVRKLLTREPSGKASSPVGKFLDIVAADLRKDDPIVPIEPKRLPKIRMPVMELIREVLDGTILDTIAKRDEEARRAGVE